MNEIVESVRRTIESKGLKQCVVAERAGFSSKEFSNLLCGRKTFKTEYVVPICNALGILPNELFGINERM